MLAKKQIVVLAFLTSMWATASAQDSARFLTLPTTDPSVFLNQGPTYSDGRDHFGGGLEIDYFKVNPESGENVTFDIVAPAAGVAIRTCQDLSDCEGVGYGNFVLIRHDETDPQGRHYFSMLAHMASVGFNENLPLRDKRDREFDSWYPVSAGEYLGRAGETGFGLCRAGCIHLHYEIFSGGYFQNPVDPYKVSTVEQPLDRRSYPPITLPGCGVEPLWLDCPPPIADQENNEGSVTEIVLLDDTNGKDIWTTSVFSSDGTAGGGAPGGGRNDEFLRVGGWGDLYYSLIQFDLNGLPQQAQSARIELYLDNNLDSRFSPVGMWLDIPNEDWDWRTSGTGRDRERLWWADRPTASPWVLDALQPMPTPEVGTWYSIDITNLYNAWQDPNSGIENFGIQLRPTENIQRMNVFRSSNAADAALRPRLVVEAESELASCTGSECKFYGSGIAYGDAADPLSPDALNPGAEIEYSVRLDLDSIEFAGSGVPGRNSFDTRYRASGEISVSAGGQEWLVSLRQIEISNDRIFIDETNPRVDDIRFIAEYFRCSPDDDSLPALFPNSLGGKCSIRVGFNSLGGDPDAFESDDFGEILQGFKLESLRQANIFLSAGSDSFGGSPRWIVGIEPTDLKVE